MKSIVLLSGGLDSVVCLKKAHDETSVELALTFDYGHRAALREIDCSRKICRRFKVPHRSIRLDWLKQITKTSLVNRKRKIPEPEKGDLDKNPADTVRDVWVPNRNGVFLNTAASFAEARGVELIVAGFNAEEAAAFPDNSLQFVESVNRSLQYSTLSHPKVISYTQSLSKKETVELGIGIGAPLDLIWSCYRGGERMCGKCESCVRAKRAFEESGHFDIIEERFSN
ncbi:MAG: 7-cyano-7-deazaguanine synthase QueC [Deltaproteobacteria bacterium]|nr:MAG: 7-cyano-7-deazaguanine synthase QueC [Deltaproteobacteria bacterium]